MKQLQLKVVFPESLEMQLLSECRTLNLKACHACLVELGHTKRIKSHQKYRIQKASKTFPRNTGDKVLSHHTEFA